LFIEATPYGQNAGTMLLTLKQLVIGATTVNSECRNYVNIISPIFVTWGQAVAQVVDVAGSNPDFIFGMFR